MSLTAAASGFVVFLLSVSVVQGQNDYGVTYTSTQICAFKGSTVDINCTYRYPSRENDRDTTVDETLWFNKRSYNEPVNLRTESEYAGRVQYHCDKNDCTLRITDLRESDSAEYKFMFITNQPGGKFTGSPGVTLNVTDLQVKVIRSTNFWGSTWAELKCHSSCRFPDRSSYIWYKNGQKIETETSSSYSSYFYPPDSYSCAVKGHEDFVSLPVCVNDESCYKVIYTDRSICASRGSSVDISCSYSSYESITSSFWFSSDRRHQGQNPSQPEDLSKDSQYEGRVRVKTERRRSTLRISDLRESDSAQYHFTFRTENFVWRSSLPGTTLTVTDPNLEVLVIRPTVSQYYTWAELKCHSSCRLPVHPSFIWYKNGQKIQDETSSNYKYYFSRADSYSCALKGFEDHPAPSVCVHDESCYKVIYTDRSICAFRGSSVDISCSYSSDESITSSFWFSSDRRHQGQNPSQPEDLSKDSQYEGRVHVKTERGRSTLRISDLRESDSAQYHFTFITYNFEWNSSLPGTTLTVTDLQVKVIRSTVYRYYTRTELMCHSSCRFPDRSSYIWYKNGQKIETETSSSYSSNIYPPDSYSCAVKGHEDFVSLPVCVHGESCYKVIYTNRSICAFRGSSVDISCSYSSDESITSSFWFSSDRRHQGQNPSQPEDLSKDSQYEGRVHVKTERRRSTLRISDLRESDSAQYHFTFITYYFEWRSSLPGTTLTVTGTDEHKSLILVTTSPVL
ncbi:hypothetical protein PAMP_021487 [Pampus punctatissimus]